jgi:hypothetical protein
VAGITGNVAALGKPGIVKQHAPKIDFGRSDRVGFGTHGFWQRSHHAAVTYPASPWALSRCNGADDRAENRKDYNRLSHKTSCCLLAIRK